MFRDFQVFRYREGIFEKVDGKQAIASILAQEV
jgi:hypothetical protein